MLNNNDVKEVRILTNENQMVVLLPMAEFLAFTELGSTYTMSFCWR